MSLRRLAVQYIRNIESASMCLAPGINLISGNNGSGKTSLLESIYFLGSARSFRSAGVEPLINRDAGYCMVRGELVNGQELIVQRQRRGAQVLRISGQPVLRTSELAQYLPVLLLSPDTVNLLLGGPALRRRFLNWGVFHVEQSPGEEQMFSLLWANAVRSLRQRNETLRKPRPDLTELDVWSREFARFSEAIDERRSHYMVPFIECYLNNCQKFMERNDISVEYQRGWEGELAEILANDVDQDIKRGYTHKGFQRADVKIRIKGDDVTRVCSRGELKILAWTLVISQGDLLDTDLVYLVDELMAELDTQHRKKICRHLEGCNRQVIATGIDAVELATCWDVVDPKMFHVEQGIVEERC